MTEETDSDEGTKEKAVKLVLFPTINKLIEPVATTLGDELNSRVKNYFSKAKQDKKASNLVENLKIVHEEIKQEEVIPNPEFAQLEFFDQWVDGIADIDPEDEIAKAWRGLLSDAVKKKGDEEILLDRLKQLKGYDANYLVQNFTSGSEIGMSNDRDKFFCERLAKAGVVELTSTPIKAKMSITVLSATLTTEKSIAKLNWIGERLMSYIKHEESHNK